METTQYEQSQTDADQQPTAAYNPPTQIRRYDRQELSNIVEYLTAENGMFDPEYILLFGKLTGGVPHSEALCYDLFIAERDIPAYDWEDVKHALCQWLPRRYRDIRYINIYVCRIQDISLRRTPHLYFAHKEGELVYCKERYRFIRTNREGDFAAIYRDTRTCFDTFMPVANSLMRIATDDSANIRIAAHSAAQAAIIYYKILYFVYHCQEFGSDDLTVLHSRMRTLSAELMLLFDDNDVERRKTLPYFRKIGQNVLHDISFSVDANALKRHTDDIVRLGDIVRKYCLRRMELYKSLIAQ